MNLRDIAEQFKRGANNAGAEAKHYAERFDSKLAEVRDSIQAQEDRYQVKYVTLTPGVLVGPPLGTFWEIEHVSYRFVSAAGDFSDITQNAAVRLNGVTPINASKLPIIADWAGPTFYIGLMPIDSNTAVWDEDINFTVGDGQQVDLYSGNPEFVTGIMEVREYSLEAVYDARASG